MMRSGLIVIGATVGLMIAFAAAPDPAAAVVCA
jgi:hypothetical protein